MAEQPEIPQTMESARLTYDAPSEKDDADMRAILSDPATMAHLRYMAKEWQGGWTAEETVKRREGDVKTMQEKLGSTYHIHDKSTGELVGVMGSNTINFLSRNSVVGIILAKKYWSGGYGTEALYQLMRQLFDDLNMHKIAYETTEGNIGMRKFLEQTCGIPLAFVRKDEVWCRATEKWISTWVYEIFEDDWPRITATLKENLERGAAKHASIA